MAYIADNDSLIQITVASGVASGAIQAVPIPTWWTERFGVGNIIYVTNASGQKVRLLINGDQEKGINCGNGDRITVTGQKFQTLSIKNLDAADATDADIDITIQRSGQMNVEV